MKTITSTICFLVLLLSGCSLKTVNDAAKLDQAIGEMLMIGFHGTAIDDNSPIVDKIQKQHIGGVILFNYDVPSQSEPRNITSPNQLKELTRQLQFYADNNLLIAIDQEGGKVARLKEKYGFAPTISHKQLGIINNSYFTSSYSDIAAAELADMGINLNMAPVVDLATNPSNPVIAAIGRSFSADQATVTRQALAYIEGHHNHKIACCLKHFPGHGSSTADSHLGLTDVTDTWTETELLPYKNIIASGQTDAIMTAHIFNSKLDQEYPATMSPAIIKSLLRNKLKYDGVIISDDMQMGAISQHYGLETAVQQAILADVDILLFANNSTYDTDISDKVILIIKEMLTNNTITPDRIYKSQQRIQNLKSKYLK